MVDRPRNPTTWGDSYGEGRVAQRTTTTPRQAEILAALEIAEPGRFLDFELPTPSA